MLTTVIINNASFKRNIKNLNYELNSHKDLDVVKSKLYESSLEKVMNISATIDYYQTHNDLDAYIYDFNFLAENKSKEINIIRLRDEDSDKLFKLCYVYDSLYKALNEAISDYNLFNEDGMSYHLAAAASRLYDVELLQRDARNIFESCSIVKYYYQFR